jgi:alpha-D-xyloside xylohydrolase
VTPPLAQIPLFVKNGGLVPMIPPRQFAPGRDEVLALEVRYYGDQPGSMSLYDDDGETFDYERGERSWTSLTSDASGGKVTVPPGAKSRWRYSDVRFVRMTK